MPVTLGTRPEHGFDQPLGLLSDCHRRIEHFLSVLLTVMERAGNGLLNDEQRRAAAAALEYFRSAAPRHTADEEQSLFPLLRGSRDPQVQAALARIDALETEHQAAEAGHAEVDSWFRQWLSAGTLAPSQVQRLGSVLRELQALYQRHIALEDQEIFPLAGRVLAPQQLAQLGRAMAQRRGL